MADLLMDNQPFPTQPASGKSIFFVDSVTGKLCLADSSNRVTGTLSRRESTATQALGVGDTYVTDSGILLPSFGMKAGMQFRWRLAVSKTAAGTAAAAIACRIGAAQTTADTARATSTATVVQTAAIAEGLLDVFVLVRSVSATGVIVLGWGLGAGSGVGLGGGGAPAVGAGFDNTALGGQFVGLSINAGAASAWSVFATSGELIG